MFKKTKHDLLNLFQSRPNQFLKGARLERLTSSTSRSLSFTRLRKD